MFVCISHCHSVAVCGDTLIITKYTRILMVIAMVQITTISAVCCDTLIITKYTRILMVMAMVQLHVCAVQINQLPSLLILVTVFPLYKQQLITCTPVHVHVYDVRSADPTG